MNAICITTLCYLCSVLSMTPEDAMTILLLITNVKDCVIESFPSRNMLHKEFCSDENKENALKFITLVHSNIKQIHMKERNMCNLCDKVFLYFLPNVIPGFKDIFHEVQEESMDDLSVVMSNYGQLIFKAYCDKQCEPNEGSGNSTSICNVSFAVGVIAKEERRRGIIAFGGGSKFSFCEQSVEE